MSVVKVTVSEGGSGSGFALDSGHIDILTHSKAGAGNLNTVQFSGKSEEQTATKLRYTQEVLICGHPKGSIGKSVSTGEISANPTLDEIQIHGGMTYGNSLGPVCTVDGSMIGMAFGGACNPGTDCPNGTGLAIPVKTVLEEVNEIIAGSVKRQKRGLRFATE